MFQGSLVSAGNVFIASDFFFPPPVYFRHPLRNWLKRESLSCTVGWTSSNESDRQR